MKNRYGNTYDFCKISENKWEFTMAEDDMGFMRFGGREGQDGPDMSDLGFFDPSGGPFIGVGTELPMGTVSKISCEDGRIFLEVEA